MVFILIVIVLIIGYWLIKGWIKFVNFLFKPFIKDEIAIKNDSYIKVITNNFQEESLSRKTINKNDIVDLKIDYILKDTNSFYVHIKIINLTNASIYYKLGDCYYVTSNASQIKGSTQRLVEAFSENNDRILPYLNEMRSIYFYNDFCSFSDKDMLVCEIIVNKKSYLTTTSLKQNNIKRVDFIKK